MDSPFSTPPDLADLAVGRSRRGRRQVPFRYLLDNRLFRLLCDPGQAAALDGFRASLAGYRLAPEGSFPDLEMTPLAILDVLGREPPQFTYFPIPKDMIRTVTAVDLSSLLVRMVKESFEKEPELQPESLRGRVEELRQQTDPAAHELFDLCLTRFVSRENFTSDILNPLAFDALFRFRFPEEIRDKVTHLFNACLLDHRANVSGLSKMRLLKVFWNGSYERILKRNPQARAEIQAMDQEMKPRTFKDFLAWEVIHHAVLGSAEDKVHPVIAFAPDSAAVLKVRCQAYKTALRAFLDQILPEELATILRPHLQAWKPGWLVPCQTDGTFDTPISTGELPTFPSGS